VSTPTPDDVRVILADFLNRKLKERGQSPLNRLTDDYDLLLAGVLDSLAFVEMITAVGDHFDWEVDLEGLDPEKLMIVGYLCRFVSEQLQGLPNRCKNGNDISGPSSERSQSGAFP
jgi:acyl carrier protein